MTGSTLDIITVVMLRALIELQRELKRRGLDAAALLEQADGQTAANEAAFARMLETWQKRE